ncbi:MAG: hypothetical protein SWK76_10570 [Actinomycetota bacterium]|nr:hypothetical protein [Actinomycetota bacterium]
MIDAENTCLTYIPINENMEMPPGTATPASIIERFIRKASHHVIFNRCPCRSENGCKDSDPNFGCTLIGEATRNIDPEVGRHVSMEEALEHLHQTPEMRPVS